MCTVEQERSAVICDVAIQHVRAALKTAFPHWITYQVIEQKGTRIDADATVDAEQFATVVRQAIDGVQGA